MAEKKWVKSVIKSVIFTHCLHPLSGWWNLKTGYMYQITRWRPLLIWVVCLVIVTHSEVHSVHVTQATTKLDINIVHCIWYCLCLQWYPQYSQSFCDIRIESLTPEFWNQLFNMRASNLWTLSMLSPCFGVVLKNSEIKLAWLDTIPWWTVKRKYTSGKSVLVQWSLHESTLMLCACISFIIFFINFHYLIFYLSINRWWSVAYSESEPQNKTEEKW
jgi:hypothetical protein